MKLTKLTAALILAGTIGAATLTAPLFADGDKYCEHRNHGSGHFGMMNNHGQMNKNPEKMIEMMSHRLDLSDEQREQAFAKLDEFRPQMRQAHQAIRDGMKRIHEIDSGSENFASDLEEIANEQGRLIADMIKLRTSMHVDFEKILTSDQKGKFNEMKKKHGKLRHGGHTRS